MGHDRVRVTRYVGGIVVTALSGAAALAYGVSDFLSGLASRRLPPLVNVARNEFVGVVLLGCLYPFLPGGLAPAGLAWAIAAGLAGTGATWLMFRLMATEPLSVICPMIAVMAAAEPAVVALGSGERLRWAPLIGVAAGLTAVALLSLRTGASSAAPRASARVLGLAALVGAGFGAYFVLLARAGGPDSGVGPALTAKLTAVAITLPAALLRGGAQARRGGNWWLPGLAGGADALGDLSFSAAASGVGLAVSGVMAAMSPAATAVLAVVILRERLGWRGGVGLGLSSVALGLLSS